MSETVERAVAEIEAHVHAAGWDRGPALFAFVRSGRFTADDPETAARLGIDVLPPDALTPVEQGDLPDQPLDELLGSIAWPDGVEGCAVTQEIVILPPTAAGEVETADSQADAESAARHPDRREARLAVGVLRDGSSASLLRLRQAVTSDGAVSDAAGDAASAPEPTGEGAGPGDELLTGPDLAPNLVAALQATLV